ncbi:transcription factor IIEalpha [Oratosquilla oratoria]|uniref:transcription factor IIEalpha n=1 Tax=Oratosquilla oratoria TaxID=337810 RepID=UPI003F766879
MDGDIKTEVPQSLQTLARLVVRGFYSIEDVLIVDMLVRNLCMNEDDLCDLLKFDRKMLRQRINTLKTDKFIQSRMKMVTLDDGKTQREQYYFINYKSFVNVVKYKLDHIRKKLEMEERDQTSRASFICHHCQKTYTDLEADQLLDITTGQLCCIICRREVQEDMSALPTHDTRVLLMKFNEQMEPLFKYLREAENIKLAAEFSDPKPQDFSTVRKAGSSQKTSKPGDHGGRAWSGDQTKKQGFVVEGSIDVNINAEDGLEDMVQTKDKPIWLSEATSLITTNITASEPTKAEPESLPNSKTRDQPSSAAGGDDVLSLLQAHERKSKRGGGQSDSDSDDSADENTNASSNVHVDMPSMDNDVELMDSDDDDDVTPLVSVGGERIPITDVTNDIIARMTQEEKNLYINAYQEYMGSMED